MGLDLITLAEVKAYAGINSTNQDEVISLLIPRVSDLVKNICTRGFIDYVDDLAIDTFNGADAKYLYTEEPNIISVSSVEYSRDFGATYTPLTEFVDYVLDTQKDRIYAVPTSGILGGKWKDYVNGYRITYNAGYPDGVPNDLKQGITDLIMYYLKSDMAVKSTKAPGTSSVQIEYILKPSFPAHIERIIMLYNRDYT